MTTNLSLPAGSPGSEEGEGPGILDPPRIGVNPNAPFVRDIVPLVRHRPAASPRHEGSSLHRPAARKPPLNTSDASRFRRSDRSSRNPEGPLAIGRSGSQVIHPIFPRGFIGYDGRGSSGFERLSEGWMGDMGMDLPKTIFITGATGLVGSHAAEEALKRGHRVRALVRPTSDTRWLDRWGVERIIGDLEDRDALRAGVDGSRLGVQLRRQGRRLGHSGGIPPTQRRGPPPAARCRLRCRARSASSTSARWASTRAATITGPTRPYRRRELARRLHAVEDRGRGPRAGITIAIADSRPRSSGRASSTASATAPCCPSCFSTSVAARSPTSARATRCSTASTSRTWSHGHLPGRREPGGRRRGLQPDRRPASDQEDSSSAGSPSWPV